MSSWEDEFRNRRKRECFCGDLTSDIKDDDLRNQEFNQCTIDPLGFIEKKYEEKLKIFCGTQKPDIKDLLECRQTENIVNLIAKEEISPKTSFKINYIEGVPKAIKNLDKLEGRSVEVLDKKEEKQFQQRETCLPTESYVIEKETKKRDGISIIQKLKSLLFPENVKTSIKPHTAAVTHQFEHATDPEKDDPKHLKNWNKELLKLLEKEKRIKKR